MRRDWLDDPSLQWEALRLVDAQLGHEIDPMSLDVIGGAAGTVLGLCAIDHRLGSDRHLEEARRLGDHLLKHAHRGDEGWSWTTMPPLAEEQQDLTGYSHGTAGIALALLELSVRTGDARFLEGALGGFAYERATLLRRAAELARLPLVRVSESAAARLLAGLVPRRAGHRPLPRSARSRSPVTRPIAAKPNRPSPGRTGL